METKFFRRLLLDRSSSCPRPLICPPRTVLRVHPPPPASTFLRPGYSIPVRIRPRMKRSTSENGGSRYKGQDRWCGGGSERARGTRDSLVIYKIKSLEYFSRTNPRGWAREERRGGRAGSGAIVKIPRGLDALEIRVINRRNSREYTPGLGRGGGGGDGRLKNASNA